VAEAPQADALGEVGVGGAHQPHVGFAQQRLAEPPILALLQEAQQARLRERRELGHLVEEERAALGLGHVAVARRDGPGEGPARVAE
jgi:hypothetical protein